MNKKLLAGLTALLMSFSIHAFASDSDVLDTFLENNWTGGAATASINEDATYVKDGTTSLEVAFPQPSINYYLPIRHINNKTSNGGGMEISATMGSQKIKNVNVWVYSTVENPNLRIVLQTRNSASGTAKKSDPQILNFTGWKKLSFEVPSDTCRIYGFEVNKVDNNSTPAEGKIYLDAITATYEYDESEKVALAISSSLQDGAERVSATPEITYTFTNATELTEEEFKACLSIEPMAEYELDIVDDKAVLLSFSGLRPATTYTVTWANIEDIYAQTASKTFTFHTANEFIDLINGENVITAVSQLSAGEYSLKLSLVNYNEAACGKECKVVVSFFNNNGVMLGVASADIAISEETGAESVSGDLAGNLSEAPARATIMVMDSWQNRGLVAFSQLGGN